MENFNIEEFKFKVSTKPKRAGGSNIVTHKLKKVKNGFAYKPTMLLSSAYLLLFFTGFVFISYGIYNIITTSSFSILHESYLMTSIAILFFLTGIYVIYFLFIPIKFDKTISRFYKSFNHNHPKKSTHFKDIIAIQILSEHIPNGESNENDYKSFEVNLVLKNATRINLIDYSNLDVITEDTKILSDFLKVPIWKT